MLLFPALLLAACQSPAPENDAAGMTETTETTAPGTGDPAPLVTTPNEVAESTGDGRDYAGIPGTAAPSEKQVEPDRRRYLYPGFRVEIQNRPPGERVTVYRPEPGGKPETLLASVEGSYFAGLYRSHLILHGGGEPGLHTLTIIDLTAPRERQVRLKSPCHGERMSITEDQLRFFVPKPGDPVECRTKGPQGGTVKGRVFEAFTYDFAAAEAKPTGEETCLYVK